MLINRLKAIFNPEQFQGTGRKRRYFEGWYFKIINKEETAAFAVIPGVAMAGPDQRQAFIQVLDGKLKNSQYFTFDINSFISLPGRFYISMEGNHFSDTEMQLDLPGYKGRLDFSGIVPWPKPWYSPGIMGPYAFAPFMECYHGVVSMDHAINGHIEIDGNPVSFDGGRGYIEKDWGRSFPSAYVWMQSNHFTEPGISLKVSVARIPWIQKAFTGFIAGVWLKDKLIRFTTYNKSELHRCSIGPSAVEIILENKQYILEIFVPRDPSTPLASPIMGAMDGKIEESMTSLISMKLMDKKSNMVVIQDTGRNACLEVAGDIKLIEKR